MKNANAHMPAMPILDDRGIPYKSTPDDICTTGLTKLEYFTAKAIQGLMANPSVNPKTIKDFNCVAANAIAIASMTLDELDKRK